MKQPSSQLSSPCTQILALVKMTFQKIPIGQPAPVANMTFSVRTTLANLYKWILFFRFEAYFTKVKASKKYLERYKTLAPPEKNKGWKLPRCMLGHIHKCRIGVQKLQISTQTIQGIYKHPHPSGPKSTFEVV